MVLLVGRVHVVDEECDRRVFGDHLHERLERLHL